jgi:TolB protein
MIHSLSYDINSKLGFNAVDWIKKKIVYSIYISPKENSIFLADITLTYRKKIISGGLNIFPKWANKEQTDIYYTKLEREPVLYKYNIYSGKKSRILSSKGMLVVSDVKDKDLLLTLAINDQPDIYKYNVSTNELQRVTNYSGIDVNAHFYGDNILFISDRLGYPNVYQKNLKTNNVSRFIYRGKNHISVTAYKDKVIISSRETDKAFKENSFNLLMMKKGSSFIKRLTFSGKNMSPIFSKNGDTILFIKEYKFSSKLGIIRLDKNEIFYFKLNRRIQSFDF